MKLSFSTKGWHQSGFAEFCNLAEDLKLDGIELHNIHGGLFTDPQSPLRDATAPATLRLLREKNFMLTPLPVVFIGGFLYHMISEGKSQYVLPYFIAMTCFAAAGIVWLGDLFVRRLKPDHLLYGALSGEKYSLPAPAQPAAESAAPNAEISAETPAAEKQTARKPDPPAQQKSKPQKKKKH